MARAAIAGKHTAAFSCKSGAKVLANFHADKNASEGYCTVAAAANGNAAAFATRGRDVRDATSNITAARFIAGLFGHLLVRCCIGARRTKC